MRRKQIILHLNQSVVRKLKTADELELAELDSILKEFTFVNTEELKVMTYS